MKLICSFSLFLSLLVFFSCEADVFYIEYQSVGEDLSWNREEPKTFEFSIDKKGKYNVDILEDNFQINIQDSPDKYNGEPSLDYWLVSKTLIQGEELEPGEYTLQIIHDMRSNEFPYISEVRARVSESSK